MNGNYWASKYGIMPLYFMEAANSLSSSTAPLLTGPDSLNSREFFTSSLPDVPLKAPRTLFSSC